MPSTIEFPFSDDEALPTIPITLSHSSFSVSTNALLDTVGLRLIYYLMTSGYNWVQFGRNKLSACHWLGILQGLKHEVCLCIFKLEIWNPLA